MSNEINGDERLAPTDRIRYLAVNFWRNLKGSSTRLSSQHWAPSREMLAEHACTNGSPSRVQMALFIAHELPKIIAPTNVRVLDLGCGAGHLRFALANAGYFGSYTGVDISDHRFRYEHNESFPEPNFLVGDAATVDLKGPYDIVISVSALEHFPDDSAALANAQSALAKGGQQVHLVPNGASLPLYLWHGLRQYSAQNVATRFPAPDKRIWKLGGAFSFFLHFLVITCSEQALRLNFRRHFSGVYQRLNRLAIGLDAHFPVLAATSVVVWEKKV